MLMDILESMLNGKIEIDAGGKIQQVDQILNNGNS